MKSKRHAKILELIAETPIETQEELLRGLTAGGFAVTQATISRDIKELRLIKVQDHAGRYRYATSVKENPVDRTFKFNAIFTESVNHVDYAGNMVVVKCYVGMANAACVSLDALHWKGVVGTIAGDDTIFILMRDEAGAIEFSRQLAKMVRK